ncbi:MAG: UDP-N-acetylmuramoyl-L-alanyl-D-glutamate--2,6-diaminopimelate ligase [Candidatus Doudnabacteria bacterium]
MLKNLIKKFTPDFLLNWYHLSLAHLANFIYGRPSEKLIVIGVTGTNGKSTTANLISKILEEAGFKTAVSSTVSLKIADREWLNPKKITMPGRFFLQKLLSDGVKAGCRFAIIESSSEGIMQHRHIGIHYDAMVFTNLTPEHIEAHKGFENYKNAKLEYFRHLERSPYKIINEEKIPKGIVINADDRYEAEFTNFKVDKIITYGKNPTARVRGTDLSASEQGIRFKAWDTDFSLHLKGVFDFYNALAAIATAIGSDVDITVAKKALEKIPNIPGRVELIDEGQNFRVLVDYAYEPEALRQLYATINNWAHGKIIHVLGGTGGGRDKARRPILGRLAAGADMVILTTDDPYDENPEKIINEVATGCIEKGKKLNEDLFKITDRREAIAKAFSLAGQNDLVLITGKGAEQTMAVKNGYIPWDDREVAREELKKSIKK